MSDGHEIVTAPGLPEPVGFAHAVVPAGTEFVFLGGQTAQAPTGEIVGETIAEQFDQAAANLVAAMRAAGCEGEHLVSMQIFCTDVAAYRDSTASSRRFGASTSGVTTPRSDSLAWYACTTRKRSSS